MERKLYPCMVCGTPVPIRSKGKCPQCRYKERKKDGTLPIYKNSIKPITDKTRLQRKEERSCLALFFDLHIKRLEKKPFSMESGKRISEPSMLNICHILPKRKDGGFPSVQCDMSNALYLTWQEHTDFDKYLEERNYTNLEIYFPNSWKIAINILNLLLDKCTERNKTYFSISEYLESEQCQKFLKKQ